MNTIKKYKCASCKEVHDDSTSAEHCCLPNVDVVYVCNECSREWDFYSEAEECCLEEDAESDEDECVCIHKRGDHKDNVECQVFINKFIGDCPCSSFEIA